MPPIWRSFLFLRVPLAIVAILAIGQALAMALDHIPLRRSYMDDLALAVTRDHTAHRVVLLGDSITLNSTRRFQLGRGPGDVANLATIAWTGAAAELFLLERYLASHPAPEYVVYASAVDDLHNNDSPQLVHYYDWNVYDQPAEQSFLRQFVPGIDARKHWPAVLDVQENILERLQSLLKRTPPAMPVADRPPDSNVRTEPPADNRMDAAILRDRMARTPVLGSLQAEVFTRICELSQRYGFKFSLVWPPVPTALQKAWTTDGTIARQNQAIAAIFDRGCDVGPTFDVNTIRAYTNFNRDGFHLHGTAWEERYAADLSQYIANLPDRQIGSASRTDAGSGIALSR